MACKNRGMGPSKTMKGVPLNKTVKDFIFIPVVVLIGIYIAGVLVQDLFDLPNAVKYLFHGVGGIGFLIIYFRKKISEL